MDDQTPPVIDNLELKANLKKEYWHYPVSAPRTVSDDFAAHKERKSLDPGTDYVKGKGSRVFAISAGRVILADRDTAGAGGRMVYIKHANGVVSHYLHLSNVRVRIGTRVLAGTCIGEVGGSGFGKEDYYGNHLHLSILVKGKHTNPETFLEKKI